MKIVNDKIYIKPEEVFGEGKIEALKTKIEEMIALGFNPMIVEYPDTYIHMIERLKYLQELKDKI